MLSKASLFAVVLAMGVTPINAQASKQLVEEMDNISKQANATSTGVKVLGYDASKQYPGESVDGWTLSYSVTHRQINGSAAQTNATVSHKPPSKLVGVNTDPTWTICGQHWWMDLDKQETIDPTCKGVLSDSCYEKLTEAVKTSEECFDTKYVYKECKDELLRNPKALTLRDNRIASNRAKSFDHDLDDFTFYDQFIKQVVISVVGFAPTSSNNSIKADIPKDKRIPGFLSCMSVTDIKQGSRNSWEEKEQEKEQEQEDEKTGESGKEPKEGAASTTRPSNGYIAALVMAVAAMRVL